MNRPFSYGKEHRLKKKSDIDAVYRKGMVLRSSFFKAYILKSGIPRLGISVPAKLGNAVFRNSQKRAAREVFRTLKNGFETPGDIMLVLVKRPPDSSSKIRDLNRIFKCLGRFQPSSEK